MIHISCGALQPRILTKRKDNIKKPVQKFRSAVIQHCNRESTRISQSTATRSAILTNYQIIERPTSAQSALSGSPKLLSRQHQHSTRRHKREILKRPSQIEQRALLGLVMSIRSARSSASAQARELSTVRKKQLWPASIGLHRLEVMSDAPTENEIAAPNVSESLMCVIIDKQQELFLTGCSHKLEYVD